ncbi:hypothetical protein A0J61_05826 [Choanephora cucurbitarum]|uniref:Uncharacterized protein n=1 Tax=Choanephora cucurbitarum TaxID=101091 RepID=A0A1C7NAP8_9FUNG|nr:hypothetical protein A0J61_05826 [Choanephora cucurbitarum]
MKLKHPSFLKSFLDLFQASVSRCKRISLQYKKRDSTLIPAKRKISQHERHKLSLSITSTHAYIAYRLWKPTLSRHETDTKVEINCDSPQIPELDDPDGSAKIEFDLTNNTFR